MSDEKELTPLTPRQKFSVMLFIVGFAAFGAHITAEDIHRIGVIFSVIAMMTAQYGYFDAERKELKK